MAELQNQDAVKFHRWRLEGCPWGHLLEVGGSKGGPVGEILRAEQRLVLWGLESQGGALQLLAFGADPPGWSLWLAASVNLSVSNLGWGQRHQKEGSTGDEARQRKLTQGVHSKPLTHIRRAHKTQIRAGWTGGVRPMQTCGILKGILSCF